MKVEVRDANFAYNAGSREHLYAEDINLVLPKGKILTILGPNGVGKTTLLKCMVGLLPWRVGSSYFDDKSIREYKKNQFWQQVGYVPPSKRSAFDLSILEYVILGRASYLKTFAQPKASDKDLAMEQLEAVGIAHLAHKMSHQVSSGELQLASIAKTLIANPKLLLLDEPESHLDIQKQVIILEAIKKLTKERGISCIINTHYPNHAFYLADYVLLLGKNLPVQFGGVEVIMEKDNLSRYFGIELIKLEHQENSGRFEAIMPRALAKEC